MSKDAKDLRADTATRLKAKTAGKYKTLARERIYPSRMLPIQDDELQEGPVLTLNTLTENANTASRGTSGPQYKNEIILQVEGTVNAAKDPAVEDLLDDLDEQVRETLMTDSVWLSANSIEEVIRIETTKGLDETGGRRHGVVIMRFTIKQHIAFPPVIEDDLTKVNIKVDAIDPSDPNIKTPGPDGVIESELDVTLPAPV